MNFIKEQNKDHSYLRLLDSKAQTKLSQWKRFPTSRTLELFFQKELAFELHRATHPIKGQNKDQPKIEEAILALETEREKHLNHKNLLSVFTSDDINRYDRKWENALASIAMEEGWSIFNLQCAITLSTLDATISKIKKMLYPEALFLFLQTECVDPPHWKGSIWLLNKTSQFDTSKLDLDLSSVKKLY